MRKLYRVTLFFVLLFSAGGALAQEAASELEKGVAFYNQGEYRKAAETLQKLVETDEKNRKAWLYLGMSQVNLKDSKAVKAFKKADKIAETETSADAPGTKLQIISKPRAPYTDEARRNMTQGTIKLAIEFGANGTIKTIAAFQTLPDGLTAGAVEAARKIRFQPATKDGQPYSTIGIITYTYTIY
jgi:DNA-binding SARP family transcriptional activator